MKDNIAKYRYHPKSEQAKGILPCPRHCRGVDMKSWRAVTNAAAHSLCFSPRFLILVHFSLCTCNMTVLCLYSDLPVRTLMWGHRYVSIDICFSIFILAGLQSNKRNVFIYQKKDSPIVYRSSSPEHGEDFVLFFSEVLSSFLLKYLTFK